MISVYNLEMSTVSLTNANNTYCYINLGNTKQNELKHKQNTFISYLNTEKLIPDQFYPENLNS